MGRKGRRGQSCRRLRDTKEMRLAGVALLAAGMILLFLCVPGWAWAAFIGALLVACGLWLVTFGVR